MLFLDKIYEQLDSTYNYFHTFRKKMSQEE
jgi:hypothetical protein